MGDHSAIEWTEATWNPVTGCDRVSDGCANCYALQLARRLKAMGNGRYQYDGNPKSSGPGFRLTLHDDVLSLPLRWRRPRVIFVNSMSDLFHPRVPSEFIRKVFAVMAEAAQHTFQILTKRPERMAMVVGEIQAEPLPNVWLGTSIELDRFTRRADALRETPAAVRFLSLEPLLGPLPSLDLTGIDWVIVGGESGPRHRLVDLDWVRELRDRCVAIEAPFFFKQVGGRTPKAGGRHLDGRTWDQMPVLELREIAYVTSVEKPIYDMIFATDHPAGTRIMSSLYARAAKQIPAMRQAAQDEAAGVLRLFDLGDLEPAGGYTYEKPLPPSELP